MDIDTAQEQISLPISDRSRRYGYLYWCKTDDAMMHTLLGEVQKITVWFQQSRLGGKRGDWRYRRISVGWKMTRPIPKSKRKYRLSLRLDGALEVSIT